MEITTRESHGVAILDVEGKVTHGIGDVKLREAFVKALDGGKDKVLINLEGVKAMDSSGLGELIRCRATAASRGAEIKLLNVNLKTYKLLTMSRLIGVFDMYDDEAKALASFEG